MRFTEESEDLSRNNNFNITQRYNDVNVNLLTYNNNPNMKSAKNVRKQLATIDFKNHLSLDIEDQNFQKEKELLLKHLEEKQIKRELVNKRIKIDEENKKLKFEEELQRKKKERGMDLYNQLKISDDRIENLKRQLENTNLEQFKNKNETKQLLNNEIKEQNIKEIDDMCNKIDTYIDFPTDELNNDTTQLCESNKNTESNNQNSNNVCEELDIHRKSLNVLKQKENAMRNGIKLFSENIKKLKTDTKNIFNEETKNFNENKDILTSQIAYRVEKINEINENKLEISVKKILEDFKNQMKKEFVTSIETLNKAQSDFLNLTKKIYDNSTNIFNDVCPLSFLVDGLVSKLEIAFKMFNDIHSNYFGDMKNNEKLREGLQLLKNNLNNLATEISEEYKKIEENSKNILNKDVFSTSVRQELESNQEKINVQYEEINNVMNEILQKINDIREKNNYEPVNKPKNEEIKKTNIIKANDNLSKIKDSLEKVNKEVKNNYISVEKEIKHSIKKFILDLLLIIDTTKSMEPYVNEVKKNVIEIIDKIDERFPVIDIRLGFIGYKDFIDLDKNPDIYTNIDLTTNHKIIREEIQNINVGGGGDDAEDLAGALEMSIEKKWAGNARYAIIVADSPCHGDFYHDKISSDDYKYGSPYNRDDPCNLLKKFIKKHISLLCLQVREKYTKKMFGKFKEVYDNKKINDFGCEFKVENNENKNAVSNMVEIIVKNTNEIFQRFRERRSDDSENKKINNGDGNNVKKENENENEDNIKMLNNYNETMKNIITNAQTGEIKNNSNNPSNSKHLGNNYIPQTEKKERSTKKKRTYLLGGADVIKNLENIQNNAQLNENPESNFIDINTINNNNTFNNLNKNNKLNNNIIANNYNIVDSNLNNINSNYINEDNKNNTINESNLRNNNIKNNDNNQPNSYLNNSSIKCNFIENNNDQNKAYNQTINNNPNCKENNNQINNINFDNHNNEEKIKINNENNESNINNKNIEPFTNINEKNFFVNNKITPFDTKTNHTNTFNKENSTYILENNPYNKNQNGIEKTKDEIIKITEEFESKKDEIETKNKLQKLKREKQEELLELEKQDEIENVKEEKKRLARKIEIEKKKEEILKIENQEKEELIKELNERYERRKKLEEKANELDKQLESIIEKLGYKKC